MESINRKIKVVVVFGGMSSEHGVSCISAYNILSNIDYEKYEVYKIGIAKDGIWYEYTGDNEYLNDDKWINDTSNCIKINDVFTKLKEYDVAFPILHGKYGEDGTIQGLFEISGIKYVGCKVLGSAIAMNKTLAKKIVKNEGINIVDYVELTDKKYNSIIENEEEFQQFIFDVEEKIGLPLIVKPNREGSSYGVSKVETIGELKNALEESFKFDNALLIEKYISNRQEIECAVIEDGFNIYASTPGEIVSANELYDFNAKYENDDSYAKIPCDISEENIEKIKEYSKKIFRSLELSSLSRVDFFVSDGNVYFNEVNTLPGFTTISMYPKMLIHDGIEYKKIIDTLIENVL